MLGGITDEPSGTRSVTCGWAQDAVMFLENQAHLCTLYGWQFGGDSVAKET